jgi:hypothetical protein
VIPRAEHCRSEFVLSQFFCLSVRTRDALSFPLPACEPEDDRFDLHRMSRAQRSTKRSGVVRCRPGTVTSSEIGTVPDQRCTANALHRIRDTRSEIRASWSQPTLRRPCCLRRGRRLSLFSVLRTEDGALRGARVWWCVHTRRAIDERPAARHGRSLLPGATAFGRACPLMQGTGASRRSTGRPRLPEARPGRRDARSPAPPPGPSAPPGAS